MSAISHFKSLPISDATPTSTPTQSTRKSCYPLLSLCTSSNLKSFTLQISCTSSGFPSWVSPRKKISNGTGVGSVARTSDWAQQEEENQVEVDGFDWDQQGEVKAEVQASDWEGEKGGESGAEEEAGGDGFEEESYPEPPEEAKLFVGNIPYDLDSENLAKLFDKAGIVEVAEVIYNRETDQSRGFGFVTMSTVEEAEKAVEMFNRYDVNGRLLTVNKAAPRGSRAERPPREFTPSFRIYVGNLPWQADDARLEQVFSEHGKVVDARVVYDRETGRSRGFGFVTMSTQTELDDAIAALDGQNLDGRAIRVNVAEERPRRNSF